MTRLPHRPAALATLLLVTACAMGPLQPDRLARAPQLEGFGQTDWPVTTRVPAAQQWFTQGVLQAYAFNEAEAVRMFKAALAQDPDCAMCAWGVAWQLGPNINDHDRDKVPEALRYLDHALRHAQGATPREQALIDALALRYAHASQARTTAPLLAGVCKSGDDGDEKPDPLDIAYAERMRGLADASPDDGDIVSLYAEAEMIATEGDWWKDGRPGGRIGEVAARVEHALALQPRHIGLNHYMIHAVDADGVAARAEAAADRLGGLAPGSPHLLHMPAHTFVRLGRFADAARVNESAIAADLKLFDVQEAQGFEVSKDWRNHDQHFLWYAALMQGRGDAALAAARELAERAAKGQHEFAEYRRSLPLLALLRLQRWPALLAEPVPAGDKGMAQLLAQHARGVALARTGRLDEARQALAQAEAGAALVARNHPKAKGFDATLRAVGDAATTRLKAEIAADEGRVDDALALQRQSVTASQRADDSEPPLLAAGAKLALGDLLLRAGRFADAEATFREDLVAHPGSGWALQGLARSLRGEGRGAEAVALQGPLDLAWTNADAALR